MTWRRAIPLVAAGAGVAARKDFEHALAINPQHAAARANLARL